MAGNQKPIPTGRLFNCPSCGSAINIRAQGLTVTAICANCNAAIDATNENLRILQTLKQRQKRMQVIELGTRGKIHGVQWEAIGYMERSDSSGVYVWSEYLLYNPLKGFRWLTEFDGHWNYILMIKGKPTQNTASGSLHYLDKDYHLFHRGKAVVQFVKGEFYWQVQAGEKVDVLDFINPPEMLSSEADKTEVVWSLGQYTAAETIREGFQIKGQMPEQTGVGPNQPSTVTSTLSGILGYYGLFLVFLVVTQFFFLVTSDGETVFNQTYRYVVDDPEKSKVTPSFELKSFSTNLEIDLTTQLTNGWFSLSAELINDETGESLEFEHGAETYTGYDSDGSWREGSNSAELLISSVPAGKYHVNFAADSRSGPTYLTSNSALDVDYTVRIRRDVATWSNFLWAIGLLSIFPILFWWRNRSFEVNRWSTSDFSPYFSSDDLDE